MSITTRILDALQAAGLTAYPQGIHEGACTDAFYVVSDAGRRATSKTTALRSFWVTVFVPVAAPSRLDGALAAAREALIGLDNLRDSGETSEPDYDEDKGAAFAAIEYTALCAR